MDASEGAPHDAGTTGARTRWWREKECWLLVAFVLAVYFSRPTALSLRGEESRWANVAREMLQSGDFIVPRQQGEVFANRPPLTNWCLALSMTLTGRHDAWAVRLPTLLSTLFTTLLVYAAGRAILLRTSAFVAGLAYATMGQVLQLGRHAESEAVLTLCVAASLLGWFVCYQRKSAPWITWCVGYGFAGLAGLAKGPQGPAYFFGTTWAFCLLFDRPFWRRREHLYGLGLFVAVLCTWQVPLLIQVGPKASVDIWLSEAAVRLAVVIPLKERLLHLGTFPWIALGCMLPWSGLLFGFCERSLRNRLGDLKRPSQYLGIAMVVGLVPLLLSVYARGRYYMPLYPCAALLTAIVVEMSLAPNAGPRTTRAWRGFLTACAAFAPAGAIFIAAASFAPVWSQGPYAQSVSTVVVFAVCAGLTAWLCAEALAHYNRRTSHIAACAIASFCGLAFTVVVVNAYQNRSSDPHGDVARVVEKLPADAELVSFTNIHHLFAYYVADVSGRSIPRVDPKAWTSDEAGTANNAKYFCFNSLEPPPLPLPFRWEQVATVSVERNRRATPVDYVIIARRLPDAPTVTTAESPAGTGVR